MEKKVIVFAPHPDDETLGCGGTIAKKIAEGYEVLVVVMTDGRFLLLNGFGIDCDPTPEEVKEIRKGEVLRATKILGVPKENVMFLDFVDGTLQENEEAVEEKLIEIFENFLPSEVYIPYEKDCHPDHQAANHIVRRTIKKLGLNTAIYKYTIMHKLARVGPFLESIISFFKRNKVRVDVSNFIKLKELATKEFKSELTAISPKQITPHTKNFDKFLNKKETFYIEH